ncbi:MAG: penicillin-binding protein [Candidatus Sumerlaeota bacterium]|nr:penicillin-binding protein [Candidatus Sumerlaeota bacterium]
MAAWIQQAPPVPEMEEYDPPEMTVIVDRSGTPYAHLFEQRRRFARLAEMPARLPEAFIAIEDTQFRYHTGVDPIGILRAAVTNARRRSMSQGASTITQQLPRNLGEEIGREKTLERKAREALVSFQMERHYSKDQILETYLNQIYLGSGNYGVEAAARCYFGKSVTELDLAECALLAGLPQLPERYSPLNDPVAALRRRNQVLDRLFELEWISAQEYDAAVTAPLRLAESTGKRSGSSEWFADAARREIERRAQVDAARLRSEGWIVETTMDAPLQRIATEVLREGLVEEEKQWLATRSERFADEVSSGAFNAPVRTGQMRMARLVRRFENTLVVELGGGKRADLAIPEEAAALFGEDVLQIGDGVDVEVLSAPGESRGVWRGRLLPQKPMQGALVCLEAHSGEILALVGGRPDEAGRRTDYFNRATSARRQAGSTLKPLFFAGLLHKGMTPDSVVVDEPVTFPGGYAPQNFERHFFGPTTLQEAMAHSRNVPTARAVWESGMRDALEYADRFAIGTDDGEWHFPRQLSVVLGAAEVTPLEIAAAYLAFANAGYAAEPHAVRSIRHNTGRSVYAPAWRSHRLLEARECAGMVQMLCGVMTEGTGERLMADLPGDWRGCLAGKSGTTSDYRDAWFVGFSARHVVAVWVGFDQPITLGDGRGGSRVAGPIFAEFHRRAAELHGQSAPEPIMLPPGWEIACEEPLDGYVSSEPLCRVRIQQPDPPETVAYGMPDETLETDDASTSD